MDGGQAHHLYRTHSPDIVTMDISMPEVDGTEGVKRILRDYPEAKIIMVSAIGQKEMVLEALRFGAKHYIIKPINSEKLLSVINKVLGIASQTGPEKAANVKLKQLATLDGLTGIPNRRHFDFILATEWNNALKDRGIGLLII